MPSCDHREAHADLCGADWRFSCSSCGLSGEGRSYEEALRAFRELAPGFVPGNTWPPMAAVGKP